MFSYLIWVQIQKKFHLLNNLYILIWDRLYFWYKVVFPLSAEQKYFGLLVNHAHLVVCCIIVQGIHFVLQRVSVSRQSHLKPAPVGHRSGLVCGTSDLARSREAIRLPLSTHFALPLSMGFLCLFVNCSPMLVWLVWGPAPFKSTKKIPHTGDKASLDRCG